MKKLILIIVLLTAQNMISQTEEVAQIQTDVYDAKDMEIKPDFPGGISKFYQFIGQNFNIPEKGENSGKIYLSFIVETDGKITNIKLLRGINPEMNQEAMRVMKLSPKWIPGKIGEENVRAKYSIPISIN
jgi:protein TonB